ncbi:fibroblast growth factor 19 [Lampris incognitus]|uniref:fibroblast growth factor 19 n=1 Tax=Lampris incognitus TaxID=2546036 RepID=UPI0024B4D77E|nr:fibroblast growth factor 19 [Lampris incognitus]
MACVVSLAMSVIYFVFALETACLPLPDEGPYLTNGWGQVVRFRHLYAAGHGLHLVISGDGKVHGSAEQTLYSLLEIRPVDPGCVVIRGVAASQFLCIQRSGRLYSSNTYTRENCTFREKILADGYNIYVSEKYGTLLSLGHHRQKLQNRGRGLPALSQFLPRTSTLDLQLADSLQVMEYPEQSMKQTRARDSVDSMDSFGRAAQVIHSPSFNKR